MIKKFFTELWHKLAASAWSQYRFEITITKTHATLQTLQDFNTLNLTRPPFLWLEYTDGYFACFQLIKKKRNNMSSHFLRRGIFQFPNSQSFPGTGAPSYHKSSQPHNWMLVFLFFGKFKITLGELLGGGHSWGTVGGHRVHSSSSVCAGRGHIQ